MKKRWKGTKYRSRWDWTTWLLQGVCFGCCMINCFFDNSFRPFLISAVMLAFIVWCFLSIRYYVDGDLLIVHQGFTHKAYPVSKIKEIKPVTLYQSAPATSLIHRIGISFTDRSVLKSTTPLIISPERQKEFIAQLKGINPTIEIDPDLTSHKL